VAKDPDEGKENPNEGKPLTTPLAARLLDRLVGELAAEGGLTPEWRETFLAVPRHLFIPDTVWQHDPAIDGPNDLIPVHRREQYERSLEIACANRPVAVQVDDGHPVGPNGRGRDISSSASHPGTPSGHSKRPATTRSRY
jgi:hypothetical protein